MRRLALFTLLLGSACLCTPASARPPTPAELAAAATPSTDATWWRHAVLYEIYPRSFQDSNGDGIGDLAGITQRLDYLRDLGVDAIWLTPVYPSPQIDFGYDISDYTAIDPQFGTLRDFDKLVAEAKKRNIRVVMDMVLNHTSDQHAWFKAAKSSRTDPKHEFYVWSDGKPDPKAGPGGKPLPPNNWVSLFGGSAWEWVPAVQQLYYHEFYKQQPDLNWSNPAVEKAMFDAVRFWLERGVAGYRLDAVPMLFEDPQRRDEPSNGGINAQGDANLNHIYTDNLPQVHDVIRRLRAAVTPYDGVLIGETYLPDVSALDAWYGGAKQDELQLPMDMQVGFAWQPDKLTAGRFRARIGEVETMVHGGQPLLVLDNHDNVRSIDRWGDGQHDAQIARALATVLLTSRGTAMLYYGEELGMRTTPPMRKEDVRDPIGITGWPREKGRDGERTPMQWDGGPNAGFSKGKPWLPVPASAATTNVKAELADPSSLLSWHRKLIALRRGKPALHDGGVTMLDENNKHVFSYLRTPPKGQHAVVVIVNLSTAPQPVALPYDVTPLATDDPALTKVTNTKFVIAPYASFIGEVR